MGRYLLGLDLGTSSVKATLLDIETGSAVARATAPVDGEQRIRSVEPGWAEQDPDEWVEHARTAVGMVGSAVGGLGEVAAVGIAYQMHGLVLVDGAGRPTRPSIIWCDGRAVEPGESLAAAVGPEYCSERLLNAPGNFTASKLAWVAREEPAVLGASATFLLPGDYLAFRMTGERVTTPTGLSEMTLWDHVGEGFADELYRHTGAGAGLRPGLAPTWGEQGRVSGVGAGLFGLPEGTPVTYRAGDQPNNALSLGVLEPGEVATTAGTSGVVYGVTEERGWDPHGRVNTFLHVNHEAGRARRGVLLCLNGCGSLYSWLRRELGGGRGFGELNALAGEVPAGSDGVRFLPYGNGAERTLMNADVGASVRGLRFARHGLGHLARAAQEGVVFALASGLGAMAGLGVRCEVARAGRSNLFLSDVFCQTFCDVTGAELRLFGTDGSQGAALGAGVGLGAFSAEEGAARSLAEEGRFGPGPEAAALAEAYADWVSRDRVGGG